LHVEQITFVKAQLIALIVNGERERGEGGGERGRGRER
jgi:hypothetical protein